MSARVNELSHLLSKPAAPVEGGATARVVVQERGAAAASGVHSRRGLGRLPNEMVRTKMDTFESLNCMPSASAAKVSELYQKAVQAKEAGQPLAPSDHNSAMRWATNGGIGFVCGMIAFFLKECIALMFRTRAQLLDKVTEDTRGSVELDWVSAVWLRAVLFAVVLVTVSATIIVFFEPHAAGSGIPETAGFLNGVIIPKTFTRSVLGAKFFSCVLAVGSGIPAGPEGPMIHMGSVAGSLVSQGVIFPPFIGRLVRQFRNVGDRRDFMSAGVAGGVAAAFGAPVGGLLFVAEEIATHWNVNLAMQIFFCAIVACTTVELLTSAFSGFQYTGSLGIIRDEAAILFNVNRSVTVNVAMFLPTIGLGVVSGLAGSLFNVLCLGATAFRGKYIKPHKYFFLFEPALLALVYISATVCLPLLFSCVPTDCDSDADRPECARVGQASVDLSPETLLPFGCPAGYYNPSASLFINSGEETIKHLFARGFHFQYDYLPLIAILLVYLPVSAYTNGIACSTGIVVPCLLNGALIGRLFGLVVTDLLGVHPDDEFMEWVDPGAFALIGAAGFFAGVSRLTMALTVIITEISNDVHFILPIMTAIMVAKWTADATGVHPIYHALMDKKSLPYLAAVPHAGAPVALFTAGQIATAQIVTLPAKVTVLELAKILQSRHNGFPVTIPGPDDRHIFFGLVSREHLLGILKSPNLWSNTESRSQNLWHKLRKKVVSRLSADHLAEQELQTFDHPEELISDRVNAELAALAVPANQKFEIDLKPYADTSAFTVPETFNLQNTYTLFRSLGLRHLVVVDDLHAVIGIITRHNLLESNLHHCLSYDRMKKPDEILEYKIKHATAAAAAATAVP